MHAPTRTIAPSWTQDAFLATMPGTFVLLWSTDFVGAEFGLPYAEPMTFLDPRFVVGVALVNVRR